MYKKYYPPETPCQRLIGTDAISADMKQKLRETMESLDPLVLLKQIREAQDTAMALSTSRAPEEIAPDVKSFVANLKTAWQSGEVRPTHRRQAQSGRWWRTRKDPFAEVWPVLLGWLEEKPDLQAREILKRLQATGYGEFPDSQLRTLQRRVRVWRMRVVRQLVHGAEENGAETSKTSDPHVADVGPR